MKEIKAIVQQFMADKVIDCLREQAHLPGITVSPVSGFSRSDPGTGHCERNDVAKMTRIEIVVPDGLAEAVVETIARAAHTGHDSDGKIFVCDVSDVIKIQTGEHGESAI